MKVHDNNTRNNRATLVSLLANILLAFGKLTAGIIGHSQALISDAINSIDDVLSTLVVVVGVKKSQECADDQHQFGHERLDNVASIILAIFFLLTAFAVGAGAVNSIIRGFSNENLAMPSIITSTVAGAAMLIKECLFIYTYRVAKKTGSTSLKGIAFDHQVDVVATGVALIGIVLAITLKMPIIDAIAALITAVLILYTAIKILISALNQMVDKAASKEFEALVRETINQVDGVAHIDSLKTRVFGAKIYVEVEIAVERSLTIETAHTIAEVVHDRIEEKFEAIKHIMIHVNPKMDE